MDSRRSGVYVFKTAAVGGAAAASGAEHGFHDYLATSISTRDLRISWATNSGSLRLCPRSSGSRSEDRIFAVQQITDFGRPALRIAQAMPGIAWKPVGPGSLADINESEQNAAPK